MVFRADESKENGLEKAKSYLIHKEFNNNERQQSLKTLYKIIEEYGPVVESYPTWHPLVTNQHKDHPVSFGEWGATYPKEQCGYEKLDHSIFFLNAFITCPYHDSNADAVISSVENLPYNSIAVIKAERLDVKFYYDGAIPILVSCHWDSRMKNLKNILENRDRTIPASIAIPLMLQKELFEWEDAKFAETWETMRPFFMGRPHGKRSSLFVSQETGQAMKNIWEQLIKTGMYGPIKVSNQE